jgi:hypothetical protein
VGVAVASLLAYFSKNGFKHSGSFTVPSFC